jgi:hypothetical protein
LASITSTQTQLDDSCYCRANNNLLEGKHWLFCNLKEIFFSILLPRERIAIVYD